MNDDIERKSILPPIMLPDILLIACCVVSAALFILAVSMNLDARVKMFMYISCVILLLYDVLFDAVMKFINTRDLDQSLPAVIAAVGTLAIGWGSAAAAAVLIYRIGKMLNRMLAEHAVITAERMLDIRPDVINAVVNGAVVQMSAGKIDVGDIISVSPGEYVAFDGIVYAGESLLDVSVMSGEKEPQTVYPGCKVLSGSLNLTGVLNIRVTSSFDDSAVSRVVKYLNDAEGRKSKREKMIAWLAGLFMPAVCGLAVIIGVLVPLIGGLAFAPWLGRAFGMLFISSLGVQAISIQLTYFCSIAGALKKGILFKGADVIDTIAHVTSVVFDMTGILTAGRFRVTAVQPNGITQERLLMLASYAAANAKTPIMRAIRDEAGVDIEFTKIDSYRESPLGGFEVDVGNNTVSAGGELYMEHIGITPDISQTEDSAVYIAVNGRYVGRILLADTVRHDSKKAVHRLQANGVDRIAMFTGNNSSAASYVATQIGISELYTETLPEDKITRLRGLHDMQLKGDRLIFAGNNDNDPTVLKRSDASIVMDGLGSGETEEAADMIIMTDSPSKVAEAIVLARHTDTIVSQNIMALLGAKGALLLLLIIGVFPIWAGVLTDVCLLLAAIVNAMRAFGMTRDEIKRALPLRPPEDFETDEAYTDETAY